MENASKALLIAGAILLVIAIIAIAMGILNQGTEVTERVSGQFDTLTIESHNSQFNTYAGADRVTKSQLMKLVANVRSSNKNNYDLDGSYFADFHVYLYFGGQAAGDDATKNPAVTAAGDNGYNGTATLPTNVTGDPVYDGCNAALSAAGQPGSKFYQLTIAAMNDKGIIQGLKVTTIGG